MMVEFIEKRLFPTWAQSPNEREGTQKLEE
jgi:hypothetical protein